MAPEVRHSEKILRYGADVIVGWEKKQCLKGPFSENKSGGIVNGLKTISGISFIDLKNGKITQGVVCSGTFQLSFPEQKKKLICNCIVFWKIVTEKVRFLSVLCAECPYTCKWCSRAVYGQSYRRRSAVRWMNCKLYSLLTNLTVIWFVDDVFTISHVWLQEFQDEINGRKNRCSFWHPSRWIGWNDLPFVLLKESGCFPEVWIGAESGSQTILDAMDRR